MARCGPGEQGGGIFTTSPSTHVVWLAGASTVMAVVVAAEAVDWHRQGVRSDALPLAVAAPLVAGAALDRLMTLGPFALTVRPDGVSYRRPLGSTLVPGRPV